MQIKRIKESEASIDYSMEAYDILSINTGAAIKLSEKINYVAFMDDVNLISNSKDGLIKLYNICQKFFKICEIKANPKKNRTTGYRKEKMKMKQIRTLITKRMMIFLILDNTKIKINKSTTGVRFLGVWINNYASFRSHNCQIEFIVKIMFNVMRWKKLTGKDLWDSVVMNINYTAGLGNLYVL